jgi:hypothetical protein
MTRRTRTFGLFLLALLVLSGLAAGHAALARRAAGPALLETALLVRGLGLTDLCLSTEANYTRHLALADRHTAFQDHPLALEHFPSGALFGPPRHLRRKHGRVD